MSQLGELGLDAFENFDCPAGQPPGCIWEGGGIVDDDARGEVFCSQCGLNVSPKLLLEEEPIEEYDEQGRRQMRMTLSKSGAVRGRELHLEDLVGICNALELSMTALGQAKKFYDVAVAQRLHLGGRGLRSVVAAAGYLACMFDNRPRRMADIIAVQNSERRSTVRNANRVLNEIKRRRLFPRIRPDARSIFKRYDENWPMSPRAREVADEFVEVDLPLNPAHHAAGATYLGHQADDDRISMKTVALRYGISRKSVSLGVRGLRNQLGLPNPPSNGGEGLTGGQIRLLREIRLS